MSSYFDMYCCQQEHQLMYVFSPNNTVWQRWRLIWQLICCECHLKQLLPCQWHSLAYLTHWGRVTHICVSNLTIIGSDNGLSPDWRQAIIWANAGILLIGPCMRNKLQWKFNRNSNIFVLQNALENVVWEMTSILSQPQCTWTLMSAVWEKPLNLITHSRNSLAPGKSKWNFRSNFQATFSDWWLRSYEIALRWMSLHLTDKSTFDLVMAWCHQATSHYLGQCWPSSVAIWHKLPLKLALDEYRQVSNISCTLVGN